MKKLEDVIRDTYLRGDAAELEEILSATKDALESHSGQAVDVEAVVAVLLDGLEQQIVPSVVEWTLEALVGATFHPKFPSVDLARLVAFLQEGDAEWLATGLEILACTSDGRHREFVSSFVGHRDPKVSANASSALDEMQARERRSNECEG